MKSVLKKIKIAAFFAFAFLGISVGSIFADAKIISLTMNPPAPVFGQLVSLPPKTGPLETGVIKC